MRYIIIICLSLLLCTNISAQKKKVVKAAPKTKTTVKAPATAVVSNAEYINNPVCKIMLVDSAVVNINDIATTLRLPQHLGHFLSEGGVLVYENDFGDTRLLSMKDSDGRMDIYRMSLLAGKWSEPEVVTINGNLTDKAYPFIGSDGQTLYFAGKEANDNGGKTYSLYMTTWDSETGTYKVPQRLPYPFVSKDADDLMFIEDDIDSLAWLVTTRRQQEGMACIYTMSLHQPWEYYDADATPGATLRSRALLEHDTDIWVSDADRKAIISRIASSFIGGYDAGSAIHFVINDNTVYTSLSDFKTSEGRTLFTDWFTKCQQLETVRHQLDEYRLLYSKSMPYDRRKLTSTIADLETQQLQLSKDINNIAKLIRNKEL